MFFPNRFLKEKFLSEVKRALKLSGIFVCFFLFTQFSFAQNTGQAFRKLSCPEKRWVIFHPFIAKKTYKLSLESRAAAKEMIKDSLLDGDENGGQVDAFRHAYWMALLSQHICWRKALNLGKAHEKGNFLDFKKGRMEEGALTDSVSSAMDLFNNKIGITIGRANKNISEEGLKKVVCDAILSGKMSMIRKNRNGDAFDCDGNQLDLKKYEHQWSIPKCLVKSDSRRE